ncbi:ABC transporter permease [Furfurilactobacillus curtus]|uniref:Iron export ABC transporter permease subunit FetB n=1 Tax=Furfurilactobacillus curtus TaxID=1746200 RepID=A0ABQ5JMC9_9LACO
MHNSVNVNNLSLAFAAGLVLVALFIGWRQKLGVNRDMIIGVIRAIVQLTIVGFVLKYIFAVNNVLLTLAMILVIIFNAAYNARKRGQGIPHIFWSSFWSILISTSVTLSGLVLSGAIKFVPSQMIPISGMIASNSMVAIGLCYRNMLSLFRDQRQQVLERIALGATPHDSAISIVRECIRTGMQPTIDASKTYGIVSLPGMMSGLIFAGVDPVYAIKYQIMVVFMLLSATSLGSVSASYIAYRRFFNQDQQLVIKTDAKRSQS